jgi:hypothetical protein
MHLPELEVGALVLIAWARLLSVKHNIVFCLLLPPLYIPVRTTQSELKFVVEDKRRP